MAAAEAYHSPLITADARLARASGIRCTVELIG
jgi:predicted nucleic acid-binding protein